jgi:hypothetical protein
LAISSFPEPANRAEPRERPPNAGLGSPSTVNVVRRTTMAGDNGHERPAPQAEAGGADPSNMTCSVIRAA